MRSSTAAIGAVTKKAKQPPIVFVLGTAFGLNALHLKTFYHDHERIERAKQHAKQIRSRPPAHPQNKDDIDSRKNEEQDDKGDDTTHNKQETRSDNKKTHNSDSK